MPGFYHTTLAPNGISASLASLKHCSPNGMPINVMQNTSPIAADVIASGSPQNTSHKMFASREKPARHHTLFRARMGKS
jgi:hypothetical protein